MNHFNRGTGLLVIEVKHSNPNGDPDRESEPRTIETDDRGLISPVSFKRKLRDLIADKDGPVWQAAAAALSLSSDEFGILEMRHRDRTAIAAMPAQAIKATYWDGRVFGSTFLEKKSEFISTGAVQFGPGVSVAPIEIERLTMTNKAGVEGEKDRGMAPLGWRVVRHGLYAMPFFVNAAAAAKSGCTARDIDLLKFTVPQAYKNTASAARPFVEIRHAWYAEHLTPLGSCPDSAIIEALIPGKADPSKASTGIAEYTIPSDLPDVLNAKLASFEDLCMRTWQ